MSMQLLKCKILIYLYWLLVWKCWKEHHSNSLLLLWNWNGQNVEWIEGQRHLDTKINISLHIALHQHYSLSAVFDQLSNHIITLHQRCSWSWFSWTYIKCWTKFTQYYIAPSWTQISWYRSVERPWLYHGRLWLVNHARDTGQLQWRRSRTQCLRNNPVPIGSNLFEF